MNKLKEYKEFFDVDKLRMRIEELERQLELARQPKAFTIVVDSNGRFNYERTSSEANHWRALEALQDAGL